MNEQEKLQELMKDHDFIKKVTTMSPEDAQAAFADKGITVSMDEILEAGRIINRAAQNNGELDIADLESVAGGGKIGSFVGGFVVGFLGAGAAVTVGILCGW